MREPVRIAIRIVALSVGALGLAAGLLGPLVEDEVEVSVVAMVTVAGAATAYEIVRSARKSGRLLWERGLPLVEGRSRAAPPARPVTLGEWEGLLASARPNADRSRVRFLRRIAPLTTAETRPLVDAIASASPEEFDDLVARFVEESRRG